MADAPERIWVARNARLKLVVNFSQHDLPGEVEYVRADLYAALEQERDNYIDGLRHELKETKRLRAAIRVDEACWLDAGGVSIGFYADGIKIRGGDFVIYDLIGATDPQVLAASLRRAIADTEGED